MKIFEELKTTALTLSENPDFPLWLQRDIFAIADAPGKHSGKEDLVRLLKEQIENFDPYAGAGCFGDSVGAETIAGTIRRIMG